MNLTMRLALLLAMIGSLTGTAYGASDACCGDPPTCFCYKDSAGDWKEGTNAKVPPQAEVKGTAFRVVADDASPARPAAPDVSERREKRAVDGDGPGAVASQAAPQSADDALQLLALKPCQCKVVDNANGTFLSQDMATGTTAGTDAQCRSACKAIVQNPSAGTQLGTTVTAYLQHKCAVTFKAYGKKAGNNYGNQQPELVSKQGTGVFTAAVPAHCPPGYSYPGAVGPTCVIDVATQVGPCPAGYWASATYFGQPRPTCVKQIVPPGTLIGTPPWTVASGDPSTANAYVFDASGGMLLYIDAPKTCPAGYTLITGATSVLGTTQSFAICRKSIAAVPATASSCL